MPGMNQMRFLVDLTELIAIAAVLLLPVIVGCVWGLRMRECTAAALLRIDLAAYLPFAGLLYLKTAFADVPMLPLQALGVMLWCVYAGFGASGLVRTLMRRGTMRVNGLLLAVSLASIPFGLAMSHLLERAYWY